LLDCDGDCKVVLFDPVAKSRWELPGPTDDGRPVLSHVDDVLPALVTVVDNATVSVASKQFFLTVVILQFWHRRQE